MLDSRVDLAECGAREPEDTNPRRAERAKPRQAEGERPRQAEGERPRLAEAVREMPRRLRRAEVRPRAWETEECWMNPRAGVTEGAARMSARDAG